MKLETLKTIESALNDAIMKGGTKRLQRYKLEGINVDLSALITIKRLQETAIEQAKTEREQSKKRYKRTGGKK